VSVEPALAALLAGLFGLLIGSFLNVCSLRWPQDESVVSPPSHCPRCGEAVRWYDNVPVVSWLVLKGRCRGCHGPISVQYPLVELATGLMWAGVFAAHGASWEALRGSLFLTILFGISLSDARFYIIPDEFSLGGTALGLALSLLPGGLGPLQSVLGAAVGYGALWLVAVGGTWLIRRLFPGRLEEAGVDRAMGGGDVKMMAMVGAFVGWQGVLLTIFLGALLGTIIFLPLSLLGRKKLVPFGVFLSVGAAATWIAGAAIIAWYRAYIGL
jgi:leader peptidase (prepilin peptidase)/N-methyltransferase